MNMIAPPSLEWPEWTDVLGQVYKPGDFVAYSYTHYKSAGLQFGVVDRINRYMKNGKEILGQGKWDQASKSYLPGAPSCTVRVIPVEKFKGKWTTKKTYYSAGQVYLDSAQGTPVTWRKPENILKINFEIEDE